MKKYIRPSKETKAEYSKDFNFFIEHQVLFIQDGHPKAISRLDGTVLKKKTLHVNGTFEEKEIIDFLKETHKEILKNPLFIKF